MAKTLRDILAGSPVNLAPTQPPGLHDAQAVGLLGDGSEVTLTLQTHPFSVEDPSRHHAVSFLVKAQKGEDTLPPRVHTISGHALADGDITVEEEIRRETADTIARMERWLVSRQQMADLPTDGGWDAQP